MQVNTRDIYNAIDSRETEGEGKVETTGALCDSVWIIGHINNVL